MASAQKHSILLVDSHQLTRQGLRLILEASGGYAVAGEVGNGSDISQPYLSLRPDLVISELGPPNPKGDQRIRGLLQAAPEARVLVLSQHTTQEYLLSAFRAGALGYLTKSTGWEELKTAVSAVLVGDYFLTPSVTAAIIRGFVDSTDPACEMARGKGLTPREREVLGLIHQNRPNRVIAKELFISIKTVEKHRSNIMRKLDVKSAGELLAKVNGRVFIETHGRTI